MPTRAFIARYPSQEGIANGTADPLEPYEGGYFSYAVAVNRSFLTRITGIDIPSGSTSITATLEMTVSVKDNDYANKFDYTLQEQTGTSTLLRIGVQEDTARSWSTLTTGVFNWTPATGNTRQTLSIPVTLSTMSAGVKCYRLLITGEDGDLYIHGMSDVFPRKLNVTWTGPEYTPTMIVNEIENGSFLGATKEPWYWESAFSTFQEPTYTMMTNDGAISAPYGGKIMKITALAAGRTCIMQPTRLPDRIWYTFSGYVYVPSSSPNVNIEHLYRDNATIITAKDQWVRFDYSFINDPDSALWLGVASAGSMDIGDSFYLANVTVTKGRKHQPYFDGDMTDVSGSGIDYQWAGGAGGVGLLYFEDKPEAELDPLTPWSTHKDKTVTWDYSDPNSDPQEGYILEMRKKF